MSKIEEIAEAAAMPVVEELGYEYAGCEYVKEGAQWMLVIYIDKPGGVTIDDCEKVSRKIEPVIDEKDPIQTQYCLCVSSPGLDRPLKKPRDFERAAGQTVDVKLYKPQYGKKEFCGTLASYDGQSVEIEHEGEKRRFLIKDTAKIARHIDF